MNPFSCQGVFINCPLDMALWAALIWQKPNQTRPDQVFFFQAVETGRRRSSTRQIKKVSYFPRILSVLCHILQSESHSSVFKIKERRFAFPIIIPKAPRIMVFCCLSVDLLQVRLWKFLLQTAVSSEKIAFIKSPRHQNCASIYCRKIRNFLWTAKLWTAKLWTAAPLWL